MIGALARKFFGSANDRRVKGYQSRVNAINALEPELAALSDEALKARTAEFRQQLADGKTLDDLLVPAFATVREAAKRTLGQRHFDVQLIGGMVLHEGDIAEMKTGEGKTLVATLAVYLNALAGKGVHVVTVNDYLARRDAHSRADLYRRCGVTVGAIQQEQEPRERAQLYARHIVYGTPKQITADWLRDQIRLGQQVRMFDILLTATAAICRRRSCCCLLCPVCSSSSSLRCRPLDSCSRLGSLACAAVEYRCKPIL